MHPEEEVQLWIVGGLWAIGALWVFYLVLTAPPAPVFRCMQCTDEIADDQFFCNDECAQEYKNAEQYYETKDFE